MTPTADTGSGEREIFNNGNIYGVQNGPANPTRFTVNQPYIITYLHDYHYFNRGTPPGRIALRHDDGTIYGPWQTTGRPGQGNVPNAYWEAYPNEAIKPGSYMVIDSDPKTWSCNAQSGNCGFTTVKGYPAAGTGPVSGASDSAGIWDFNGNGYLGEAAPVPNGGIPVNVAQGKKAEQSSTAYDGLAQYAVDGNTDGNYGNRSCSHTGSEPQAWWQVDLGGVYPLQNIVVWNRTDSNQERLSGFYVLVSNTPFPSPGLNAVLKQPGVFNYYVEKVNQSVTVPLNRNGRYVRIQLTGTNYLHMAEVQVFAQGLSNAAINHGAGQDLSSTGSQMNTPAKGRWYIPSDQDDLTSGTASIDGDKVSLAIGGNKVAWYHAANEATLSGDFEITASINMTKNAAEYGQNRRAMFYLMSDEPGGRDRRQVYIGMYQKTVGTAANNGAYSYGTDMLIDGGWGRYNSKPVPGGEPVGLFKIARKSGEIATYYYENNNWMKLSAWSGGIKDRVKVYFVIETLWDTKTPAEMSATFNYLAQSLPTPGQSPQANVNSLPATNTAGMTLDKEIYVPGEEITVNFQASAAWPSNAWIGIIPSNTPHGDEGVNDQNDIAFQYLNGRAAGTIVFKAPGPGQWDLRMNDNDAGGKEAAAVSFTVGNPTATNNSNVSSGTGSSNSTIPGGTLSNLAQGKKADQSSIAYDGLAQYAVDGNTDGTYWNRSCSHTGNDPQAWWEVDLGEVDSIQNITIWNRTDSCVERLSKFYVLVSNTPFSSPSLDATLKQPGVSNYYLEKVDQSVNVSINRTGRYVRIQLPGTDYLNMAEVQVFGRGQADGAFNAMNGNTIGSVDYPLTLAKTTYYPGEEIKVNFQASAAWPGNAWIGIIPSNTPHGDEGVNDQNDIAFQYLNGRTQGAMVFQAPGSGQWDFRMNDTDAGGKEISHISFKVQ